MKIFPNTTVYVCCIANMATGGPELLHQLASHLIKRNIRVRMYYYRIMDKDPVHEFYKKYHVPIAQTVDDLPQNILIVPESQTRLFKGCENIRRIIWWLSVDNWASNVCLMLGTWTSNCWFATEAFPKMFWFDDPDTTHWVQSEYARRFLLVNGVPEEQIRFVGDYLNPVFLQPEIDTIARLDVVIVNPKKGFEFAKKLMDAAPDLQWGMISHLTPAELHELLQQVKVYIDFGGHPGRDRIPREAVASGCCIITGRRGSAGNEVDVPIPDEFKYGETEADIPKIIEKIRFVMAHFEETRAHLAEYRRQIFAEPQKFAADVDVALEIRRPTFTRLSLLPTEKFDYERLDAVEQNTNYRIICCINDRFIWGGAGITHPFADDWLGRCGIFIPRRPHRKIYNVRPNRKRANKIC